MLVNQISLAFFFLYFVLMSGPSSKLLNCSLQRYINESTFMSHIMIFMSIYFFTFILNWYSIDSLVVEKFETLESNSKPKSNYLMSSLYYTIVIYLIFLLSTKSEVIQLVTFILGIISLVGLTILNKFRNAKVFESLTNNLIVSFTHKIFNEKI